MNMKVLVVLTVLLGICSVQLDAQTHSQSETTDPFFHSFTMHSDLGHSHDYTIQIALPRSYYTAEEKSYPVLYLLDADFCFNIARDLTLGLGWAQQEIIVAGIGFGSPERAMEIGMKEFGDTPDSAGTAGNLRLLTFFRESIIPKVEGEYRTVPENRTIAGYTAGSRFIYNVLLEDPGLFSNYIIGGGYFNNKEIERLYAEHPVLPVNIYFGMGEWDGAIEVFNKCIADLCSRGFGALSLQWDVYPRKDHEVAAIADLLDRGMRWIYADRRELSELTGMLESNGVANPREVYCDAGIISCIDYNITPAEVVTLKEYFEDNEQPGLAAKLDTYIERHYPLRKVVLQFIPGTIPEGDTVFIAGNLPCLAGWNPHKIALTCDKTGVWSGSFDIMRGTHIEYKVTRGSWDCEAADQFGRHFNNYQADIESDTTITHTFASWKDNK